jgi:hypothetical protein
VLFVLLLYYILAAASADMDLFTLYSPSGVLLCILCSYAVLPTTLATYIRVYYLNDARNAIINSLVSARLKKLAELLANYLFKRYKVLDPATIKILTPPTTSLPIPEFRLYRGY